MTRDFDVLRAKLEAEIPRPAVIALTSSTQDDGREFVARGIANSLVAAGYATLFLHTSQDTERSLIKLPREPEAGALTEFDLGDASLQRISSRRDIAAALQAFSGRFDYVVVNLEYEEATAFATSVIDVADAVLVAVRKGRREGKDEAALSAALDRVGARFLGVVTVDPHALAGSGRKTVPKALPKTRRDVVVRGEKEAGRREAVEWRA